MVHPTLTNPEIRQLKAKAQHLEPVVRVGKSGMTPAVAQDIEQALTMRELIKIRFEQDRDERDVLAGKIAQDTGAVLIMQVGKVAVFYRASSRRNSGCDQVVVEPRREVI